MSESLNYIEGATITRQVADIIGLPVTAVCGDDVVTYSASKGAQEASVIMDRATIAATPSAHLAQSIAAQLIMALPVGVPVTDINELPARSDDKEQP